MWNSSDIILPSIATTPVTIPWNSILIAVYFPAIIFLYGFTAARKAHNFSEGGWTALFVLRIVEGLIGVIIPLTILPNNKDAQEGFEWMLSLPCSLFHDLGTFCIVLSFTRALFLALDIWEYKAVRRLWGWILVFLPIPGYFLAGIMISFLVVNESELQTYHSKLANGYNNAAYYVLRANIGALGGTLLAMTPCFIYVFIKRRRGQVRASSTAEATAVVYLPTLILMLIYLINDMFRFVPGHNPTMVQHFALSLAPEIIVVGIWMFLARVIGKCDRAHIADQEVMRKHKAEQWNDDIDRAVFNHEKGEKAVLEKYTSAEESNSALVESVYDCTVFRLERLQKDYQADSDQASRNYDEEVQWLVLDARENVNLVAANLVLSPCDSCVVLGRWFRRISSSKGSAGPPFAAEKTGKLVLKALKKNQALKNLESEEIQWIANDIVRIHLS